MRPPHERPNDRSPLQTLAITAMVPVLVLAAAAVLLAACTHHERVSTDLRDPCDLVTDALLHRLAPGGERVPTSDEGTISASRSCEVDLTSSRPTMRGDLGVTVSVDGTEGYDGPWRARRCKEIGSPRTTVGPGDVSCFAVRARDGLQSRIDGWAWVGDDRAAHVELQIIDPAELPASARRDLRQLLARAIASVASN